MTDDNASSPWVHEFRKATGLPAGTPAAPGRSSERRRETRFLLFNAPARLTLKRRSGLFGLGPKGAPGEAVDLSEGGAQIAAGLEVTEGSPVELQIEFPKFKDTFSTDGVVAWCRADPKDPSRYLTGIMFVGLDSSMLKKIGFIRQWFTSDYCSEFREHKPASEKSIAVPAERRGAGATDPLSVRGEELEPGIWSVTLKGSLEGPDFEPLETVLVHALRHRVVGVLLDLRGARAKSARGLQDFLYRVDELGRRGARTLFVASPPGLKELFDQRNDRKRNFVPDLAIGRSLLAPTRPPDSPPSE